MCFHIVVDLHIIRIYIGMFGVLLVNNIIYNLYIGKYGLSGGAASRLAFVCVYLCAS